MGDTLRNTKVLVDTSFLLTSLFGPSVSGLSATVEKELTIRVRYRSCASFAGVLSILQLI